MLFYTPYLGFIYSSTKVSESIAKYLKVLNHEFDSTRCGASSLRKAWSVSLNQWFLFVNQNLRTASYLALCGCGGLRAVSSTLPVFKVYVGDYQDQGPCKS